MDKDIETMPKKKRGRKVLLGEQLNEKLQMYLTTLKSNGDVVSAQIAMVAVKGLLLSQNQAALAEYRGNTLILQDTGYTIS